MHLQAFLVIHFTGSFKKGCIVGTHSIFQTSRRTEGARSSCRKRTGNSVPRTEKVRWPHHSTSQSSHWRKWISKKSSCNPIRAKQKTAQDGKEFKKVSRAVRKAESHFAQTIPWSLAKSCQDVSWDHRTIDLRHMVFESLYVDPTPFTQN